MITLTAVKKPVIDSGTGVAAGGCGSVPRLNGTVTLELATVGGAAGVIVMVTVPEKPAPGPVVEYANESFVAFRALGV